LTIAMLPGLVAAEPAAPTPADRREQGKIYFQMGMNHFRLKNYEQAMKDFKHGYESDPRPLFLFNVAQSAREAGNRNVAVDYYQRYLAAETARGAPQLEEAARWLHALGADAPTEPAPPAPPSTPTPPATGPIAPVVAPPPPPPPSPPAATTANDNAARAPDRAAPSPRSPRRRALGWTGVAAIAVGGAAAAAGIALTVDANALDSRLDHPMMPGMVFDYSVLAQRDREQQAGIALFAAAGALMATGTILAAIARPRRPASHARAWNLLPSAGVGRLGVTAEARF
jgi:tetratricopeptide (TPR) repeat protein